jgi:hypothetical protein
VKAADAPQDMSDLRRACVILNRPQAWTRGASARNLAGEPVDPLDPSAVTFCARGAVVKAIGTYDYPRVTVVMAALCRRMVPCPSVYNDEHEYEDVIDAMRQAAK